GSYIARAIQARSLTAICWAIAAMFVGILIYDQILFRPLTASADWFRLEQESGLTPSRSWALTMMRRSRLLSLGRQMFGSVIRLGFNRAPVRKPNAVRASGSAATGLLTDMAWYAAVAAVG